MEKVNSIFDAGQRKSRVIGTGDEIEKAVLKMGLEEIDVEGLRDGNGCLHTGVENEIGGIWVRG